MRIVRNALLLFDTHSPAVILSGVHPSGEPNSKPLRYWQWRVLLALMFCYLFYYTGRLAIGHAMPLMEQDLGYSKQQLGWLTAVALGAYGVGQAINGNLGDWLGGRRMITLGALGSMALCWAFSFMDTALWLVVFWGANGFVQSMGWAPGGRLISLWWPRERRGLAFGLYMLSAGMATVLVWCTSDLVLGLFLSPHGDRQGLLLFDGRLPRAGGVLEESFRSHGLLTARDDLGSLAQLGRPPLGLLGFQPDHRAMDFALGVGHRDVAGLAKLDHRSAERPQRVDGFNSCAFAHRGASDKSPLITAA